MYKKVLVMGGGTGISFLLKGLKDFPVDITAVITVSDNGRSTGRLREEFHTPAVGDIRKVITNLSQIDDPIKKMVEQIGNIVLEMEMNPQNANGINHSGVKLGKVYEEYEKILEDIMKENLHNLKEEEALKTFEKMKTLLETDKNPRSLISDNYKIINRTKKKLTKPLVEFFTEYTKSRFNISNKNYSYTTQNENFDDFSEESEREILNNINNDINNIKKELIEKEMESSGLPKKEIEIMVNNYVDKNGDDMITLYKEMILFHFREKQFHRENDQKIQKMLKGTKTDSCIFD